MKTCGFENQINLYLDGELSGEKLRAFEAHLEACPACREEVEQYRGLLDELHVMEEREVPPMLEARLHAALANETLKGDGRVKRKLNPWALSAAAAVLVLVIGGAAFLSGGGLGTLHNVMHAPAARGTTDNGAPSMADAAATAAPQMGLADHRISSKGLPAPMPTAAAAATMAPMASESLTAGSSTSIGNDFTAVKPDASAAPTPAGGSNPPQQTADSRKIIYTADIVVETRDYNKCLSTVAGLYAKYGGYKATSQLTGVPDSSDEATARAAMISIRIPIDKYDAAMSELKAMGNVLSENESTQDVSRDYVDTEARNKTLKDERDRLEELLAKADSTDSLIALQNQITDLTTQIEQQTAQLNFWDNQVSYSTITVEIHEIVTSRSVKPVDPDMGSRVNSAFYGTLNSMKKGLENFEVGFMGFLPWLAIIILAAGAVSAVAIPASRRARQAAAKKTASNKKEE